MSAKITQVQINEKTYDLADITAREDITNFYKNHPQLQLFLVEGSNSSAFHSISTSSSDSYDGYDIMHIRTFIINTSNCSVYIARPYFQANEPSSTGYLLTASFYKKAQNENMIDFDDEDVTQMVKRMRIGTDAIRSTSYYTYFLDPSNRNKYWNIAIGAQTSVALTNARYNIQSFILTKDTVEVGNPSGTNTISITITLNKNS